MSLDIVSPSRLRMYDIFLWFPWSLLHYDFGPLRVVTIITSQLARRRRRPVLLLVSSLLLTNPKNDIVLSLYVATDRLYTSYTFDLRLTVDGKCSRVSGIPSRWCHSAGWFLLSDYILQVKLYALDNCSLWLLSERGSRWLYQDLWFWSFEGLCWRLQLWSCSFWIVDSSLMSLLKRTISSAKRWWMKRSLSILMLFCFQDMHLNTSSKAKVNNSGKIVAACLWSSCHRYRFLHAG